MGKAPPLDGEPCECKDGGEIWLEYNQLSGMPRRVPDYPDAFLEWNVISSYGSVVSVVASVIFFYALYATFANLDHQGVIDSHIKYSSQLYETDEELKVETRGYHSLEWVLPNPPLLHSFEELPLLSGTEADTHSPLLN